VLATRQCGLNETRFLLEHADRKKSRERGKHKNFRVIMGMGTSREPWKGERPQGAPKGKRIKKRRAAEKLTLLDESLTTQDSSKYDPGLMEDLRIKDSWYRSSVSGVADQSLIWKTGSPVTEEESTDGVTGSSFGGEG